MILLVVQELNGYLGLKIDTPFLPFRTELGNIHFLHLRKQYGFSINSLWLNDDIRQQSSRWTMSQIKSCCLMAPSHYLKQCWLLISALLWNSPESNFTANAHPIIPYYEYENYIFDITTMPPLTNIRISWHLPLYIILLALLYKYISKNYFDWWIVSKFQGPMTHWAELQIYASLNEPSLVHIMAWCMADAKPLSEPILEYC